VGRAICQTILKACGSGKLVVPQGVAGGPTACFGTARHVVGGGETCSHFPPQLKARQELMPTRGIRLFN